MIEVTEEQLRYINMRVSVVDLSNYISPLNNTLKKYEINTVNRVAAFLAQVGVESAHLTHMHENLNYSAQGLLITFGSHFHATEVVNYAHNPEKIANRVYANRMGNGPESSGDGWKFRGRGFIQITGKDNYKHLSIDLKMPLDDVVKYLESIAGAWESAGWYWNRIKANQYADISDIIKITRLINGGLNGLEERKELFKRALEVIK